MILHRLDGCAPTPLANYLKALGVLRIVSEQLDPAARGWWEGERYLLATHTSQEALLDFFADEYEPTAIISPWNKGSGFFLPDDPGVAPLERSTAARFAPLRQGICAARSQLEAISRADAEVRAIKAEAKNPALTRAQREQLKKSEPYKQRLAQLERNFKELKAELIPQFRRDWRGPHREWMDAAIVINESADTAFPSLLGTGGNDGRFDFTNNYMQRLGELFDLSQEQGIPRAGTRTGLEQALFGRIERTSVSGLAIGQFIPGGAGGANAGAGPDSKSRLNPWDFILMLEGAVSFTASSNRRMDARGPSRAAAPFALASRAAAYSSAASSDEGSRGEQWMPFWSRPLTYIELHRLLAEGRAQINNGTANEPLDMALAVARLGVARGIDAFQRYGYIERNGQSNLAVPLGRFVVPEAASSTLANLDDLTSWIVRLRRQARDKNASTRLTHTEHRLTNALFAVVRQPSDTTRWQEVLLRMADVEVLQIRGSGTKAGPIPRLRPEWVEAADDGSPEIRLALAFALQSGPRNAGKLATGVRRHWLTLEKGRFKGTSSDRVIQARNGIDDAIALVSRRLIEAAQNGMRQLPLLPGFGCAASRHDLARLVAGDVDLDRCLTLARALMALDLRACQSRPPRLLTPAPSDWPDDAWNAIRLALLPWPLPDGRHAGCDPAIVRRLESGDLAAALTIAIRRLRAAGIPCTVRAGTAPPETARRYAAALAFPIARDTAAQLAQRLSPTPKENAA